MQVNTNMSASTPSIRRYARRAIPFLLLPLGMWLLVGCLYLPIPEHRIHFHQKDFRPYLGARQSDRPIRAGAINRAKVVALLGPPPFASQDGRSIAYILQTERGFVVWPLCFAAGPTDANC